MTIELPKEVQAFVESQLATGNYNDESDVVKHALEMLKWRAEKIAEIQEGYQRGLDDLKAGRYREINSPEDAQALAADIKKRGRELRAEREKAAS